MRGQSQPGTAPIATLALLSAVLAAAVGASYGYVDLSLNRMGASSLQIGWNAAMPAIGWLLATPLMPWALARVSAPRLIAGLLMVASATILCFPLTDDQGAWLLMRFLFGGACGMAFRIVEYWIAATSPAEHRARNMGIYGTLFCAGAALGSALLPIIGTTGWSAPLMIAALVTLAAVPFARQRGAPPPARRVSWRPLEMARGPAALALVTAAAFGALEAVPYTFMPVQAVRAGMPEQWALLVASAYLAGLVLLQVPMGLLADRVGKLRIFVVCTALGALLALLIPLVLSMPLVLLATMALWGGSVGSLYVLSLAHLADYFTGEDLIAVNAGFGTLYALGSLLGPILFGTAMEVSPHHGLAVAAAALLATLLPSVVRVRRRAALAGGS